MASALRWTPETGGFLYGTTPCIYPMKLVDNMSAVRWVPILSYDV
jgi:hypothetical protein